MNDHLITRLYLQGIQQNSVQNPDDLLFDSGPDASPWKQKKIEID